MSRATALLATLASRPSLAHEGTPEERLDRLEHEQAEPESRDVFSRLLRTQFFGYLQPQLVTQIVNAGASPNLGANGTLPAGISPNATIAQPDGTTTNQTLFRLRRARLRAEVAPSEFSHLTLEIEPIPKGATNSSVGTFARTVEAIGIARLGDTTRLEIAAGQFNLPFGSEIMESNAGRPFIDSSYAMGAMFPGDFDIGARGAFVSGGLTVMASVVNGVMLGEKSYAIIPDKDRGKDGTFRIDYDFGAIDVGASAYLGGASRIDTTRLWYKQYRRYALNAEATLHQIFVPKLGLTKVVLGITTATNMDRGVTYAFTLPDLPDKIGGDIVDKHELAGIVRVEQDATKWLTLGVRYDYYGADTRVKDDGRHAFGGVAAVHFTRDLQTMLEYDVALDHTHAAASLPSGQVTRALSAVFQIRF